MRHYVLVPSLRCPASCSYCFGPHTDGEIMRRETVEAVAAWSSALADGKKVDLTFHGGEPLTARSAERNSAKDVDAPPMDCTDPQARARRILASALQALEGSQERWLAAGLPV